MVLRNIYTEYFAAHDQGKLYWIGYVKTILKLLDLDKFALSKAKFKSVYIKIWNTKILNDQSEMLEIKDYRRFKTSIKQEII